jgi:hypothetical protein
MVKKALKILALALVIIALLVPGIAYADTYYTVDSGRIDDWNLNACSTHQLVRWPNGTLWTVYTKLYSTQYELYVAYSVDEGLNWYEAYRSNIGHQQKGPAIATTSNWDLHIVWAGRGGGSYPNAFALYYQHYDFSEDSWDYPTIIKDPSAPDNYGHNYAEITVDSEDNLHVLSPWNRQAPSDSDLWYLFREYNGDGTWGSWDDENIHDGSYASRAQLAVDKDDYVGVGYSKYFMLRDPDTKTWGSQELVDSRGYSATYASLMASVSGGDTVWRMVWFNETQSYISYNQRQSGAWGSAGNIMLTSYADMTSIAQEHGPGDGDTGDFYAITGDGDGWAYRKYELGVGWGSEVESTTDADYMYATKALWPMFEGSDWHWNMPASGFAMTFGADGGDGWDDGNELWRYYLSGDDWGSYQPYVTTEDVDNITEDSARFEGRIWYDGDSDVTERGFEYGQTQSAEYTVSETGTFPPGYYYETATDLESDTVYYFRFYAVNAEGTSYGDWIGFITGQPTYESEEEEQTGNNTLIPPLPDEPGGVSGWVGPPKVTGEFGIEGARIPYSFFLFLLLCALVVFLGIVITMHTKSLGMLFLVLGFVIGFFCFYPSGGYLHWWTLFPFLLVGIALLFREGQYGWS